MMYCHHCGSEVYLIQRIINVKVIICEECENTYSVKENGKVDYYELQDALSRFQRNFEENRENMFENSQSIINKVISERLNNSMINVDMLNPERDRNVEAPGKIVYRG